jgi:endonuclease YncB( thermonuclease family)
MEARLKNHRFTLSLLLALLPLALLGAAAAKPAKAAAAPPLQGVVSKVVDGDTLWLAVPGQAPLVVRLLDMDAPEICQAWGEEARRALAELALNKSATLRSTARDAYGRVLGVVVVDEINLSRRMVEDGHAWSTRSRYDRGPLVKQERMAKSLGRGLHSRAGAQFPADFRKAHGPCEVAGR